MAFDPNTMTWEDDDDSSDPLAVAKAPETFQQPGSLETPTYNFEGGGSTNTGNVAPTTPTLPAGGSTTPPVIQGQEQANVLANLDVTQDTSGSSATTESHQGSSGKVLTDEAAKAQKQQVQAGSAQVEAAKKDAEAKIAESNAKIAGMNLDTAMKGIQAQRAQELIKATEDEKIRVNTLVDAEDLRVREMAADQAKSKSFWGEQSTPKKIGWGIALLLGAFGRSGNRAAGILNETVTDWGKDRRERLESQMKSLSNTRTWASKQVGDYLESQLKLNPLYERAALLKMVDLVKAEMEAKKGQLSAEAIAAGQKFIADAEAKAADKRVEATTAFAPTASSGSSGSATQRTGQVVQTGGKKGSTATDMRIFDLEHPDRTIGNALGPAEATKVREGHRAANQTLGVLGKLQGFIDKEGTWTSEWLEPSSTQRRSQLSGELIAQMGTLLNTGVLNAGEYERYVKIFNSKFFQSSEGAKETLEGFKQDMRDGYKALAQSQGLDLSKPPPVAPKAAAETSIGKQVKALAEPAKEAKPSAKSEAKAERKEVPGHPGVYMVKKNGKWVKE